MVVWTLTGIGLLVGIFADRVQATAEWSRLSCPPRTHFSYCLIAEAIGPWPVVNANWTVLGLAYPWMVELRDPYTGEVIGSIAAPALRRFLGLPALSPNGRLLASYLDDGTLQVWDLETNHGLISFRGPERGSLLAFSSDGRFLAGSGSDGKITVWDLATGSRLVSLHRSEGMSPLEFSPDGRWLVGVSPQTPWSHAVWELLTGRLVGVFPGPVAFLPTGQFFRLEEHEVYLLLSVWDGPEGERLQEVKVPYPEDTSLVEVSPNWKYIAFGSAEGVIRVWHLDTAREVTQLDLKAILGAQREEGLRLADLSFDPTGNFLLTVTRISSWQVQIHLWNVD